jgi:16S rRNA processing protein RimM
MSGVMEQPAGPPTAGGPEYLVVGKIRRPHGVRGEMVAETYADLADLLKEKCPVYVGEKHAKLTITSIRHHNEGALLGLDGVISPEQAGRYRNQIISISHNDLPELENGEYYAHELMDLSVRDEAGNLLGTVTEVLETGANDVYVVTDGDGRELLLPAIPDVIMQVDLEGKSMVVHLLPGLSGDGMDDK